MSTSRWRMAEPRERFPSHVVVTAVREREIDGITQVIERVMIQPTSAYESASYRLLEVEGDEMTNLGVVDTLREARRNFRERAERRLRRRTP